MDLLEAGLATGLLAPDEAGTSVWTAGLQIVSRLGQYFVVSTSRSYPGFDPAYAEIYLGPESYTLANYLPQRRAGSLPSAGRALDLCSGSGIAGQSLAATRRGLVWTGVDLAPLAVEAAVFDAMLNEVSDRYTPIIGDLYEPVAGQYFQLIVANPPFIPVPATIDFPIYGDGGEDGLSVWPRCSKASRLICQRAGGRSSMAKDSGTSAAHSCSIYLERIAASGLTIGMTLLSTKTIEQTLFSIGRTLAAQSPPRIKELAEWHALFERLRVTRYDNYVIEARAGGQDGGRAVVRCDADPPGRIRTAHRIRRCVHRKVNGPALIGTGPFVVRMPIARFYPVISPQATIAAPSPGP